MYHAQPQKAGKTLVKHHLKVTNRPNRLLADVILAFSLFGFLWPHHAAAAKNGRHQTKTRMQASADAFGKIPSRYVPQYGGFCACHLTKGGLADSDTAAFFVYKGKLYVWPAADTAKEFRSNIDENIRRADENLVKQFGWHGNPPLR